MSKKRKSCDSYPSMAGIFTRSKSHTFFHHQNRSGRSRIDEKSINETLNKRARTSENDLSIRSTELSSVKDLRARRIFSSKESERFEEFESEVCVDEKKLISKDEAHAKISAADLNLKEEQDCVQATPPDPQIVISRYENGTSSGKLEKDEALNDTSETEARFDAVKKLVPSPRRPVKIFKVPGSLSYRRLLPYLMDVAKESSNQVKDEEHMSDNDGEKSNLKVEENQLTEDQEARKPCNHGKGTEFVTDNLLEAKGNYSISYVEKRECKSVNVSEKVGDINEQSTNMLIADADTLVEEKENGVKECSIEGVAKSSGQVNGKLSNQSGEIVAKAKLGQKRCSRLELLKAPDSFSLRRLLPYLCEINKDSSGNGDSPKVGVSSTLSSTSGSDLNLEKFRGQSNSTSSAPEGSPTLQEGASLLTSDHASNSDHQPNIKPLDNDGDRDVSQVANVHLKIESHSEADSAVLVPVDRTSQLAPLSRSESSVRNHADQSKGEENRSHDDGSAILNVIEISEKIKLEENPLTEDQETGEPSIHEKQAESVTHNSFEAKESNVVTYVEKREGESDNVFEEVGDLKEQPTNMLAENADVVGEKKGSGVIVCSVEGAAKNSDQVSGDLSDGSGQRNINAENGKTTAKAKLGPKRCSKMKLFKTPDSYNYRRLLPYLRMINKDGSGFSSNGKCPGVESLQENAQSSLSLIPDSHDLSLVNFQGKSNSMSNEIAGSLSLQKEAPSNSEQPNTMTPDSIDKNLLQVVKIQSKIESHSEIGSAALVSVVGTSQQKPLLTISPSRYPPSLSAVAVGAPNGLKQDAAALLSSPHGQLSNPSYFVNNGPKSCILKRNPRGCRGLCLCLNCTSFRLHAERAFEFSKNQMQDAEEVTLDLINELSSLRSLLQESALQSDSCQIDMKQMKEACERASEAEELARTRINEMNYDLEVHCRITCKYEPKVRFANNVQIRKIP